MNDDREFAQRISELEDDLEKEREDKNVHISHKDTLRKMLDDERSEHRNTKGKSEEEIKKVEAEQRQRATARIFKLQVSQQKAAKALRGVEDKHKKSLENIADLESTANESEKREEAFRQGEIAPGSKRRADNAMESGENCTHSYFRTRRAAPVTTALIPTPFAILFAHRRAFGSQRILQEGAQRCEQPEAQGCFGIRRNEGGESRSLRDSKSTISPTHN